jgi:hypothetical protein
VPIFALDLGVDQLRMTGTYLAGDYEVTLADRVIVDAIVEGEPLHAERTVYGNGKTGGRWRKSEELLRGCHFSCS